MPMAPPRACATCGRPGCQDHRGGTRAQRTTGRRLSAPTADPTLEQS